jgi:DNA-binding CsgD family transcriptional regulator
VFDRNSTDVQDELLLTAYEHVVAFGRWDGEWLSKTTGASADQVAAMRRALADLRVIDDETRDGWRAVSPRLAMAELVLPIDAEVHRRATRADSLRHQLQMLLPVYEANVRSDSPDTVQVISDYDELAKLIDDESTRCGTELAAMQATADLLARSEAWHHIAHRQDLRIRTIHRHTDRQHGPTGAFVETFGSGRVEFRTAAELPVQLLIFDGATCVLMDGRADGAPDGRPVENTEVAVVLRHPLVVRLMARVFAEAWSRGTPFVGANTQSPPWLDGEYQRSILRLLSTGAKDDAVARRLGISIRTCRRHISEAMSILGVSSRFQAGVEAVRRGLI